MKIEKNIWDDGDYYHYYEDSKTNIRICHGLVNVFCFVGYRYHNQRKGFYLRD